ncbi:MAG: WxcM-like domain-containing protein, partial [Nitrososphaerales archaeon]
MTSQVSEVRDLKNFIDDRGALNQIFNDDLPFQVKRMYTVYPRKGIIRGLHGHKKEWKAFWVISGAAKFVVIPMNSGEQKILILDHRKPQLLIVPPEHYNGFVALDDNTVVVCLSSLSLAESTKDDYRVEP